MPNFTKIYFCNLIFTFFTICYAGENELNINSDFLFFNKKKNIAEFKGNVIVWFDDLVLLSNDLKIFYKKNALKKNEIDQIVMSNPLKALKIKDSEVLIAASGRYYFQDAKLVLKEVELMRGEHLLKTHELIYYGLIKKISKPSD